MLEAGARERKVASRAEAQFNSYDSVRPVRNVPLVTIDDQDVSANLNDLTMGELRSLMNNFQTKSKCLAHSIDDQIEEPFPQTVS